MAGPPWRRWDPQETRPWVGIWFPLSAAKGPALGSAVERCNDGRASTTRRGVLRILSGLWIRWIQLLSGRRAAGADKADQRTHGDNAGARLPETHMLPPQATVWFG